MRAVVYHGVGDIRVEDVPRPSLVEATDAIIAITTSAICGTDLHFVRGTIPGTAEGRILGHEAVGTVEELGEWVRNFRTGDRVVVGSTICCGTCSYCRAGYTAQCDNANPNAPTTAFYGGPDDAGGYDGLQAEYARIPFANVNMVRLPGEVSDTQAILISDIFPTGYQAADLARIRPGDIVAVFGCGPVGQFAIWSAFHFGAGRVLAIDAVADRLEAARTLGAETIDYDVDHPVQALRDMTRGIGPDRVIDAVGIESNAPDRGPARAEAQKLHDELERTLSAVAPETNPSNGHWHPGNAPFLTLQWAVAAIAKAGTLSIIGVYPPAMRTFPIGQAMMKNLKIAGGNCNHRRYIPELIELVRTGAADPTAIVTQRRPIEDAVEAYAHFDGREAGWLKVALQT